MNSSLSCTTIFPKFQIENDRYGDFLFLYHAKKTLGSSGLRLCDFF